MRSCWALFVRHPSSSNCPCKPNAGPTWNRFLQIGALRRRQHPSLETGASSRDLGGSYHGAESSQANPGTGDFRQNEEDKTEASTPRDESGSSPPAMGGSEESAEPEMQTPPGTPLSYSIFEDVRLQTLRMKHLPVIPCFEENAAHVNCA